jgi:curli production assembly/transport component CsgF
MQTVSIFFVALVLAIVITTPAQAQDIRYQPVNPSFGGNPLNSSHLQGIATSQNKYKDPDQIKANDPTQQFIKALQSRLYSAVATQVTDALFGPNPVDTGHIISGNTTIDFLRDLTGITLTVTDATNGTVTTILVPNYTTVN